MLGRLNSHELRPLVDPGVFFAEKIDLSSRQNNAICYDPKLITAPKTFHIQDIARLLNVGEALFDLALIAVHLAV